MKKLPEGHQETQYGICRTCGKQGILPCEACQAEALRLWKRKQQSSRQELPVTEDLSIRLVNPDWHRRYEEVRDFRDTHGYPMWSEQWHTQQARQSGRRSDNYQEIS